MILHWSQQRPDLTLQWRGPNKITNKAITSLEEITSKVAIILGPQGRPGEDGQQGPAGLPGDGSATFIWQSPSALESWLIAHNQEKYPAVTVVDSTGRVVNGEITYHNNNLVEIAFAFPVSGTAYLN